MLLIIIIFQQRGPLAREVSRLSTSQHKVFARTKRLSAELRYIPSIYEQMLKGNWCFPWISISASLEKVQGERAALNPAALCVPGSPTTPKNDI
jgi:hypothetical protein